MNGWSRRGVESGLKGLSETTEIPKESEKGKGSG